MSDRKDDGFVFKNERLPALLNLLMAKYRVIGPVQNDHGVSMVTLKQPDELCLNYQNTVMPQKKFFLPQTESLITFDPLNNESEHSDQDINTTVLIGLRPCDVLAVSHLDRVFLGDTPQDPYYRKRREAFRIISLACNDPQQTCFCTSVGCRPDSIDGADIIMHQLNGRYFIRGVTAKGDDILALFTDYIQPASKQDIEEKEHLAERAYRKVKLTLDTDKFRKKTDEFQASWWEDISQKCLGCGICTYFCPTCHCFDITDEVCMHYGRRIRTWDSCMYPSFTLHASGHNPRTSHKERMRQRIMHKFNYSFKNYDRLFCVGCGRCILHCPVNLDIRQIIRQITGES
jgi:sulfhydrogenase subunit beta (sulfur reductase)